MDLHNFISCIDFAHPALYILYFISYSSQQNCLISVRLGEDHWWTKLKKNPTTDWGLDFDSAFLKFKDLGF